MFGGLRKYIPITALILGMSFYLHSQFKEVFQCPSCYLFVDSADGLKNYFTPAYFVKHDPAGLWFNGMNYPYGEHIVYTDNQPIISLIMQAVGTFFDMDQHVIGTINMLMILSLLLAAICIFLLLRSMGLPGWYAAVMSVPIALLSPQIARFNGHYSLAYTFYIPLFLLLLVRWANSEFRWKRSSWLILWIVFMGFTHLYFFFIAIIFLTCFGFLHFALHRLRWNKPTASALIAVLVSAIVVYGTVKLTDPIDDRPVSVYGVYTYTAKPAGTFLPWYKPANEIWQKAKISRPDVEGSSYIGGPSVLLFPFLLFWAGLWIKRRYFGNGGKRKARQHLKSSPAHPIILFTSAVFVWLIATGWIYEIGGGILIDIFPVIGQFRSLGRLAWIFYYVVGISTAYAMYVTVRSTSRISLRYGLIAGFVLISVFWVWESDTYLKEVVSGRNLSINKTFRNSAPFSDLIVKSGNEAASFQAILQFPLASIGSEKLNDERGFWFMRKSWQCAWETGLPIINSIMSRTSISQTLSLIQILSDPYIDKARLESMDDRPLILLASRDQASLLKPEKRIIALADSIGEVDDVGVYILSIDKLTKSTTQPADRFVYKNDYDDQNTELAFSGQGALFTLEPRTKLISFIDTFTTQKVLEYSSWSRLGPLTPLFVSIRHEVYNTAGKRVKRKDYNMHNYHPTNVIGEWIETRFFFGVDGSGAEHKFFAEPAGSWVDRIRIR